MLYLQLGLGSIMYHRALTVLVPPQLRQGPAIPSGGGVLLVLVALGHHLGRVHRTFTSTTRVVLSVLTLASGGIM